MELDDPEEVIRDHNFLKLEARHSPAFRQWVSWIIWVMQLKKSGYPFEKDDLNLTDWLAVQLTVEFFQAKKWQPGTQTQ